MSDLVDLNQAEEVVVAILLWELFFCRNCRVELVKERNDYYHSLYGDLFTEWLNKNAEVKLDNRIKNW